MGNTFTLVPASGSSLETSAWFGLRRAELLTIVYLVCVANSLLFTIYGGIMSDGLLYSVSNTFEVSAIVWCALVLGTVYSLRGGGDVRPSDKLVSIAALVCCLLPLGPLTWAVLTVVALYSIVTSPDYADWQHRAGWIFLAVTMSMFWSKRLFNFLSEWILSIDAILVSSITQTERVSNLVAIPGGGGYLQIAAQCSSMANVSLAILCWVVFTQATGVRWRVTNVLWCAGACVSVVAINVMRISAIGFRPNLYELIHGPVGATITSWVICFVVLTICYFGVGRGRFHEV